jgi:hypothetical protein
MGNQVNPDGTVQVSPPLASAFGPASASAPPPPPQPTQTGQPTSSDPSFAGAIMALIHSLAANFAPKSITQAKARTDQSVEDAVK